MKRLPDVMTSRRSWVRAAGKVPKRLDGRNASSTASSGWASYREVVESTVGDGFGIMLGDGLAAWDFDHCFEDGRLSTEVAGIIAGLTDVVWCERSMSGDGLHVFVLAPEGKGTARPGVEFYSRARFIRVTGDRYVIRGGSDGSTEDLSACGGAWREAGEEDHVGARGGR